MSFGVDIQPTNPQAGDMNTNPQAGDMNTNPIRGDVLDSPCVDRRHGLRAVGQWSLTDSEFDPGCPGCVDGTVPQEHLKR